MSEGAWACKACADRAGQSVMGLPSYEGLGFCGAGDHAVEAGDGPTLWWFAEWAPPLGEPLPSVTEMMAAPSSPRRGRYAKTEQAGQMSFWDQL